MIVGCVGFPPGGERVIAVLDRKYFVELLLNAVFIFVVITTVALLGIAPIALYRLPGLGFGLYLHYVSYLLVQALSYLLPLTMLIAVVFVYGRAAADHEVTTLKASGIHPFRVLVPGLLLALLIGLGCLEVESSLGPSAIYQLRAMPASQATLQPLIERAIAESHKSLSFDDRESSITISWVSADVPDTGGAVLKGILFEQEPKRGPAAAKQDGTAPDDERTMISAREARVRVDERHHEVHLVLTDAKGLSGKLRGSEREEIELVIPVGDAIERSRLLFLTLGELFALRARAQTTVEIDGESQPLLRAFAPEDVEGRIHERFARAASPLAFLLLGFPLALVFKSGNRMVAFLIVTLIGLFVYYPTCLLSDTLLKQQLVGPIAACWSGNALIAAIGLLLLGFVVRR